MKIILLKEIRKLGVEGDLVKVKDGYARNFLLPQGMALKATDVNCNRIDDIKKTQNKSKLKQKELNAKLKERIEKISLTITVEAKENEELYGKIGETQILKLLKAEGVELEKGKLVLDEPISKLGVYNLKINLGSEIESNLRVWAVKK
ncbi:MAG: 50S ribosomal protein L9 [Candidatus Omnitrophica bacterium]|nr:50S ribosomal protein L9 [Candidatus Omnitrophota bacterium]MCK5287853.1 50S ribosomal protein L9 [Candidatus Omnitrophota bacterium]